MRISSQGLPHVHVLVAGQRVKDTGWHPGVLGHSGAFLEDVTVGKQRNAANGRIRVCGHMHLHTPERIVGKHMQVAGGRIRVCGSSRTHALVRIARKCSESMGWRVGIGCNSRSHRSAVVFGKYGSTCDNPCGWNQTGGTCPVTRHLPLTAGRVSQQPYPCRTLAATGIEGLLQILHLPKRAMIPRPRVFRACPVDTYATNTRIQRAMRMGAKIGYKSQDMPRCPQHLEESAHFGGSGVSMVQTPSCQF